MKLVRAIIIGIVIWIIGVNLYTFSYYVPILEDAEQQANIWLSIVVLPIVWLGAKLYYSKEVIDNGFGVGLIFFMTSAILDALITVPFTILPYGGTYYDFFIDFGFWFIGFEFIAVTVLYRHVKLFAKKQLES